LVIAMTYARASTFVLPTLCWLATLAAGCSDPAPTNTSEGGSGDSETTEATATPEGTTAADDDAATSTAGSGDQSSGAVDDTTTSDSGDSDSDTGEPPGVACLDEQFVSGMAPGPNYSDFDVQLGSHCNGTNQQDITDIERVVFVGDSVTVGTPPTGADAFYRSIVADELAAMFGLQGPEFLWKQYDPFNGTSVQQESGDFASCAVWGARNEDLLPQLEQCFAPEDLQLRTLVITTMGGNDGAALARDYLDGVELATILEELEAMVAQHEMAVDWLVGDPSKFPAGVFVVNANVYEFTDFTMDLLSCPAAGTAGFDSNSDNPDILLGSLNTINAEYMRIAEENGTDVVFMAEGFCGHGYHADDPQSPCYRGPGNENWFDLTCIHPTPTGHGALAQMFLDVITE
jgi:lysophospholipase L1-like esterase